METKLIVLAFIAVGLTIASFRTSEHSRVTVFFAITGVLYLVSAIWDLLV